MGDLESVSLCVPHKKRQAVIREGTGDRKCETRNWKLETGNPKIEIPNNPIAASVGKPGNAFPEFLVSSFQFLVSIFEFRFRT
jgi:hypothetical protein